MGKKYLVPINLSLFVFFLPLSPTLKSIFLITSLIAIIASPDYRKPLREAYNTLWARAALAFFVIIVVAACWGQAPIALRWMMIGKYAKLVYLPLLAVGFIHKSTRNWCITAYLLALFITCIVSMISHKTVIAAGDLTGTFYNHIVTGFMMAFAFYLAALLFFQKEGVLRWVYGGLALVFSYQLFFINTGRTGYIMYVILVGLLALQKLTFKKALLSMTLLGVVLFSVYELNPIMQGRVDELVMSLKAQTNTNTSLGFRRQFHHYAYTLFITHPIGGIGTGGFKPRFIQDQPMEYWGNFANEPHSQYWMLLVEQGLLGLTFFLLFLLSLLLSYSKLVETKAIFLGIFTTFCIGAFSDTILCYSVIGYLLIIMSALCFGEVLAKSKVSNQDEKKQTIKENSLLNEGVLHS